MFIGEGSTGAGSATVNFWAQEGQAFTYNTEPPTDFTDGDWVWAVVLEELVSFSNP
jgi:hypothetical protein